MGAFSSKSDSVLNAELAEEAKIPITNLTNSVEGIFGSIYASFIKIQGFIAYLFNLLIEFFKMLSVITCLIVDNFQTVLYVFNIEHNIKIYQEILFIKNIIFFEILFKIF